MFLRKYFLHTYIPDIYKGSLLYSGDQPSDLFLGSLRLHDYGSIPLVFDPSGDTQFLCAVLGTITEAYALHISVKHHAFSDNFTHLR